MCESVGALAAAFEVDPSQVPLIDKLLNEVALLIKTFEILHDADLPPIVDLLVVLEQLLNYLLEDVLLVRLFRLVDVRVGIAALLLLLLVGVVIVDLLVFEDLVKLSQLVLFFLLAAALVLLRVDPQSSLVGRHDVVSLLQEVKRELVLEE